MADNNGAEERMTANRAISPAHTATVMASAGTGKTWLLVTRIIRLLLAGARPDAILAITFTRKAALEMQTRLTQRLFELAAADTETLNKLLADIDAPAEATARAPCLYEEVLRSEQPIRITTFHAFCQDLLKRFPLEAGVSPGFELVEQTVQLQRAARGRVFQEATGEPEGVLAQALNILSDHCRGSMLPALDNFLQQRSDWWAYTDGQDVPAAFATQQLRQQLKIEEKENFLADFFCEKIISSLGEYRDLLVKHDTNTNLKQAGWLARCLADEDKQLQHLHWACSSLLTKDNKPFNKKSNKVQQKAMGDAGQARFLQLHEQLASAAIQCLEKQAKLHTYSMNKAWYFAGDKLLAQYQALKSDQGVLDFSDLEWRACRLLNDSDNAQWVQYKLDQRIDHLLVDEFQDTNPTQWNLLLPLLEELAAGESERERSAFLVGDSKQSIYRFRRADAGLLDNARVFLSEQLDAVTHHMAASWRSAPAIIDFINQVFSAGTLNERLRTFQTHTTQLQDLAGQVEILPLCEAEVAIKNDTETVGTGLRNPLEHPRIPAEDKPHYAEGRLIAARIQELISAQTLTGSTHNARPINYSDIFILLRKRTHAYAYEAALREAGIPFLGAERGTLLDSLEILDMLALLDILVSPHDDLALAQVLRSPLFACSDDDLMLLAGAHRDQNIKLPWIDRLTQLGPTLPSDTPLQRACSLLNDWQASAGSIPVHDLLDRIYFEGELLARYAAAFPVHLKTRVRANLARFLELALDTDNGRYPSLMSFRAHLRELAQHADAPDAAPSLDGQSCVRMMTIHAAKGLEAPVVFLADAASKTTANNAYHALVNWPSGTPRPSHFLLIAKKSEQDELTRILLEEQATFDLREDANLLYVALTRAKQMLFISASESLKAKDLGWYGLIAEQYESKMSGSFAP